MECIKKCDADVDATAPTVLRGEWDDTYYIPVDCESLCGDTIDSATVGFGIAVLFRGVVLRKWHIFVSVNPKVDREWVQYAKLGLEPSDTFSAAGSQLLRDNRTFIGRRCWRDFWSKNQPQLERILIEGVPPAEGWPQVVAQLESYCDEFGALGKIKLVTDCPEFDIGAIERNFLRYTTRTTHVRINPKTWTRYTLVDPDTIRCYWDMVKQYVSQQAIHDHMPDNDAVHVGLLAYHCDRVNSFVNQCMVHLKAEATAVLHAWRAPTDLSPSSASVVPYDVTGVVSPWMALYNATMKTDTS